jgi:1,6-anhydro-N-acetylmuramate kinase
VQGVPRQSQRLGDSPASPMAAVDVMRTLLELTALSVARGVAPYAAWRVSPHVETQTERPERSQPDPAGGPAAGGDLLVCGGGARNRFLLQRLAALLPGWHVAPTDAFGVPAQWMEAMAFAWFAHCTQAGVPASVPSVTGAQRPCVLGAVYRPW